MTASMTDAVLIDLATKVDPGIEVVFIDTGYHFPETLATVEEVRRHYGLNLRMMTVARQEEELWQADPENCCSAVKVGQLDRALAGKEAWMSGLRRGEAATRAAAPIVVPRPAGPRQGQPHRHVDRRRRRRLHRRPRHHRQPADRQGYPSIGCMPCTSPVARRRPPLRPLARPGQDGVRPAPGLRSIRRPPPASYAGPAEGP